MDIPISTTLRIIMNSLPIKNHQLDGLLIIVFKKRGVALLYEKDSFKEIYSDENGRVNQVERMYINKINL